MGPGLLIEAAERGVELGGPGLPGVIHVRCLNYRLKWACKYPFLGLSDLCWHWIIFRGHGCLMISGKQCSYRSFWSAGFGASSMFFEYERSCQRSRWDVIRRLLQPKCSIYLRVRLHSSLRGTQDYFCVVKIVGLVFLFYSWIANREFASSHSIAPWYYHKK